MTEACALIGRFVKNDPAPVVVTEQVKAVWLPYSSDTKALHIPHWQGSRFNRHRRLMNRNITLDIMRHLAKQFSASDFNRRSTFPARAVALTTNFHSRQSCEVIPMPCECNHEPKLNLGPKNLFNHISHLGNGIRVTRSLLCSSRSSQLIGTAWSSDQFNVIEYFCNLCTSKKRILRTNSPHRHNRLYLGLICGCYENRCNAEEFRVCSAGSFEFWLYSVESMREKTS